MGAKGFGLPVGNGITSSLKFVRLMKMASAKTPSLSLIDSSDVRSVAISSVIPEEASTVRPVSDSLSPLKKNMYAKNTTRRRTTTRIVVLLLEPSILFTV